MIGYHVLLEGKVVANFANRERAISLAEEYRSIGNVCEIDVFQADPRIPMNVIKYDENSETWLES